MIIPAVVSVTFRKNKMEEVIEYCKKANIQAIEWSSNVHLSKGDIACAKKIKEKCAQNGIEIAGYATYYQLGEYEEYRNEFNEYLLSAKKLGAKLIRIWAGTKGSDQVEVEERNRLIEEANVICEMARNEGITVSYEYHSKTLTDTLDSTLDLLEAVPQSRTHWQIKPDLSMEENLKELRVLKKRLGNIHVQHCINREYRPLCEIAEDLAIYFEETQQDEKRRYACIEFVKDGTMAQFLSDASVLNKIYVRSEVV